MEAKKLLEILSVAEQLKCRTRHCDTSSGRRESVAEHSWRVALMAMLMEDEFPDLDIDKVIRMCLIHDLGEAFTGDIPAFLKKSEDGEKEEAILERWVGDFPAPWRPRRPSSTRPWTTWRPSSSTMSRTSPPGCRWSMSCSSPTAGTRWPSPLTSRG